MRITEVEVARQLETIVENETQRVLRKALEALGPNGERWYQGDRCSRDEARFCAYGAVHVVVTGTPRGTGGDVIKYRDALRRAGGVDGPSYVNDSARSFSEVRAMFHRAIELAAS